MSIYRLKQAGNLSLNNPNEAVVAEIEEILERYGLTVESARECLRYLELKLGDIQHEQSKLLLFERAPK